LASALARSSNAPFFGRQRSKIDNEDDNENEKETMAQTGRVRLRQLTLTTGD